MNSLRLRLLVASGLFLVLVVRGTPIKAQQQVAEKNGTVVVEVTWGDIDNTPANDVYVEAFGFVPKYNSTKSFVLKMSHDGHYEASLPPGIYDLFVSEGTSVPRCRRVLIRQDLTTYWTLKLEIDDVYTNRSMQRRHK